MTRTPTQFLVLACLGLVLCLPASGEVILDDDFEGTTLDGSVWEVSPWSTGAASVSDSRLSLTSWTGIEAYNTYGLNYVNMDVYGVATSGFGFGLSGALGGWVLFGVDENHDARLALCWSAAPFPDPLHTTSGLETIDLGPASDGDFHITWTPVLFEVINNGQVLFSRDDPDRIPYYYAMGPFSMWTYEDAALSVDRVVVWTPEPATLSIVALGALLLHHSHRRRRK